MAGIEVELVKSLAAVSKSLKLVLPRQFDQRLASPGGQLAGPREGRMSICRMCGKHKPLIEAHILPRAFYPQPTCRARGAFDLD